MKVSSMIPGSPVLRAGVAAAAALFAAALAVADPPADAPAPTEPPPSTEPAAENPPAAPPAIPPAAEKPAAVPAKKPSIIKTDTPKSEPQPGATPPAEPPPASGTPDTTVPPADAPPAEPVETELVLKDKRRIVGVLISKNDETVTLSVGGVPTTFNMYSVEGMRTLPSIDEQYRSLRASIDPGDAEGLVRLAEWLRSRRRLDEALIEVDRALKSEPTNSDARNLKTLIIEQQKLAAARRPDAPTAKPAPKTKEAPAPAPAFPLLTDAQINLIRVYEVDLTRPPRLVIPRAVIDEFIDAYAGTRVEGKDTIPNVPEKRAMFVRLPAPEILSYMFALRAREFYGKVQVLENPRAMTMFRDDVNRGWLVNSCATSRCHGGEEAGRLWLYDKKPMSDAAAYTNFFILENFKTSEGVPLINYDEPAMSPLLQLGLPREQSKFKHPEVGGAGAPRWKPAFRGTDDPKFEATVQWIRAMYPKRTAYPIDYSPPMPRGIANDPGAAHDGPR